MCYTLGDDNDWLKFDDRKFSKADYTIIQNSVQGYMLFYELI